MKPLVTTVSLPLEVKYSLKDGLPKIEDILVKGVGSIAGKLRRPDMLDVESIVSDEVENKHIPMPDDAKNLEMEIYLTDMEVEVHGTFLPGAIVRDIIFGKSLEDSEAEIEEVIYNGVDVTLALTKADIKELEKNFIEHALNRYGVDYWEQEMDAAKKEPGFDESIEKYNKKLDDLTDRLERKLRSGKVKSKLAKKTSKIPGFSYWFQRK
ncbi:MAG: hypothetical protein IPN68_10070 [Bacteroidetes bacterium]|nr:hypothetical protein [Bacteroidota bacterium]